MSYARILTMFNKLLYVIVKYVFLLCLALFLLFALYIGLMRYYLPNLNAYKQDIQTTVSYLTKQDIEIGSMHGKLDGLTPIISINDVRLFSKEHDRDYLRVKHVRIQPNLKASLTQFALRLKTLNLDTITLYFHEENNQWAFYQTYLDGSGTQTKGLKELFKAVDAYDQISARNVSAQMRFQNNDLIQSPLVHMRLRRSDSLRQIKIVGDSPTADPARVFKFVLESESSLDADELDARWLFNASQLDLSMLSGLYVKQGVRVNAFADTIDFKGRVGANHSVSAQGLAQLSNINVVPAGGQPWRLNRAVTDVKYDAEYEKNARKHTVYVKDFSIEKDDAWQNVMTVGKIEMLENPLTRQVKLASNAVSLDRMLPLLNGFPWAPEQIQSQLKQLKFTGDLSGSQLYFQQRKPSPTQEGELLNWEFATNVTQLSNESHMGLPSVHNANAWIWLNSNAGVVNIKPSKKTSIHFNKLYQQPFAFNNLTGDVAWIRNGKQQTYVYSHVLRANYNKATLRGWFSADLNHEDAHRSALSLNLALNGQLPASVRHELIPKTVPSSLVSWLNKSIKQGQVNQASLLFHGDLKPKITGLTLDHPVAPVLELGLDVKDASVVYDPKWPMVSNASAQLWMSQRDLDIRVHQGTMLNSQLSDAVVTLRPKQAYKRGPSLLTVGGDLAGSTNDIITTLTSANVNKSLTALLSNWRMTGNAKSKLLLSMALGQKDREFKLQATSEFDHVDLTMNDQQLHFSQLAGVLAYDTNRGLYSNKAIKGVFDQQPVLANIKQYDCQAASLCTRVEANGLMEPSGLKRWVDPALLSEFSGKTKYNAKLDFLDSGKTNIYVNSSLQGIASDLPAPLGKTADQSMPLVFSQSIQGKGGALRLNVNDEFFMRSKKLSETDSLTQITFGKGATKPAPSTSGVHINGALASVDGLKWQTFLTAYAKRKGASKSPINVSVNDLSVATLRYKNMALNDVSLSLNSMGKQSYVLKADSDSVKGSFHYDGSGRKPSVLNLSYFNVSDFFSGSNTSMDAMPSAEGGQSLPSIQVNISKLIYDKQDFGHWSFFFSHAKTGFDVSQLKGRFEGVSLDSHDGKGARYRWSSNNAASKGISYFKGLVSSSNIETQLKRLNINSFVRAKESKLGIDVSWVGSVKDFTPSKTQGSWSLFMKDGSFLRTSSAAAGASKVLSLVNVADILKNLKLSFSDLAEDGLSFRTLNGEFNSAASVFETNGPTVINGSSSKISLDGYVNSYTGKMDLDLVVTIPIRSNLPFVAGFLVGLPAAAGVYIASKLMKTTVDQLSSLVYKVSGDIKNPQVKFKKIFDFKLPKSKRRQRREAEQRKERISENVPASIKASSQTLNNVQQKKRRGLIQRKVKLPKRTRALPQRAHEQEDNDAYQVTPLEY